MMHMCPACRVERADYEGPGIHLPECPNCGSTCDPEPFRPVVVGGSFPAIQREGPLDVEYIERYGVTKGVDCPCRSKTVIRALIAEVRQLRAELAAGHPTLTAEEAADIQRRFEAATRGHRAHRVAVLGPLPLSERVRRGWRWPWRR